MSNPISFMEEGNCVPDGSISGWNSGGYVIDNSPEQFGGCILWEDSMGMNDPLESALSSIVSSPTASSASAWQSVPSVGKLGSICSSGDIPSSPFNNSPSKPSVSMLNRPILSFPGVMTLCADPGFVERAARSSSFMSGGKNETASTSCGKLKRLLLPSTKLQYAEFLESREGSSISDQNQFLDFKESDDPASRKRKLVKTTETKAAATESDPTGRRSNQESESNTGHGTVIRNSKLFDTETEKDYIHVRARRGQATDSHSLAERVRREKISERMKLLQDLVPGCNKVTGKALMLDEIINYVQSLQRQVEFLSMKLATINPPPPASGSLQPMIQPDPYCMNPVPTGGFNGLQWPEDPGSGIQRTPGMDCLNDDTFQVSSSVWRHDDDHGGDIVRWCSSSYGHMKVEL